MIPFSPQNATAHNRRNSIQDRRRLVKLEAWALDAGEEEALRVACNPRSKPEILHQLIRNPSERVKIALTENPNTPFSALVLLGVRYPKEFIGNPAVDLIAVTDPHAYQRAMDELAPSIYYHIARELNYEGIDQRVPESKRIELAYSVYRHETLEYWLARDPSTKVRRVLADSARLPETHGVLAFDPCKRVRLKLAGNRTISAGTFRILSHDLSPAVQLTVANNSINSEDSSVEPGFHILACSPFRRVRAALAKRSDINEKVLGILGSDPSRSVRLRVARNKKTKSDVLDRLILDSSRDVRIATAAHKELSSHNFNFHPTDDFRHLATLCKNPSAPSEFLIHQINKSGHEGQRLRKVIGRRIHFPRNFGRFAATHSSYHVRAMAASKSGVPGKQLLKLARDPNKKVRLALAQRLGETRFGTWTDTNVELVHILAADADPEIRAYMPSDHRLSQQKVEELREDLDARVRLSVASTNRFEMDMYVPLLQDSDPLVRYEAASNILRFGDDWGVQNNSICFSSIRGVKRMIKKMACHLMPLATDDSVDVRSLLAWNSNTPADVLNCMMSEQDEDVRSSLIKRSSFPRDAIVSYYLNQKLTNDSFYGSVRIERGIINNLTHSPNTYVRGMVARHMWCKARNRKRLVQEDHWFINAMAEKCTKK